MPIREPDSPYDLFGQPRGSRSISLPPPPPAEPSVQDLPPLARQEAAGGARRRQTHTLTRALSQDDGCRGHAFAKWNSGGSPCEGFAWANGSACGATCRCAGRRAHTQWSVPLEDNGLKSTGYSSRYRWASLTLPMPPPAGRSCASSSAASPFHHSVRYGWRRPSSAHANLETEASRPLMQSGLALPLPPQVSADAVPDRIWLRQLPPPPSIPPQESAGCPQVSSPQPCPLPALEKKQVAEALRRRLLCMQIECDAISRDFERLHEGSDISAAEIMLESVESRYSGNAPPSVSTARCRSSDRSSREKTSEATIQPASLRGRDANSKKRGRKMRRETQRLSLSAPLPFGMHDLNTSPSKGPPPSLRDTGSAWCSGPIEPMIAPAPSIHRGKTIDGKVSASTPRWPWPSSGDDSASTTATATFDSALESTSVGTCGSVASPPPTVGEIAPSNGGSGVAPTLNDALLARVATLSSEESTFSAFVTPRAPTAIPQFLARHSDLGNWSSKEALLEAARISSTPDFMIADDLGDVVAAQLVSPSAAVGSSQWHCNIERSESPLSRATTRAEVKLNLGLTGLQC